MREAGRNVAAGGPSASSSGGPTGGVRRTPPPAPRAAGWHTRRHARAPGFRPRRVRAQAVARRAPRAAGHEVVDHGPADYDARRRLPALLPACRRPRRSTSPGTLGIVIGGSGNGEQIAANKVRGVRAALAWSLETAPARPPAQRRERARRRAPGCTRLDEAISFVEAFLAEPFSRTTRHARRIAMLADVRADRRSCPRCRPRRSSIRRPTLLPPSGIVRTPAPPSARATAARVAGYPRARRSYRPPTRPAPPRHVRGRGAARDEPAGPVRRGRRAASTAAPCWRRRRTASTSSSASGRPEPPPGRVRPRPTLAARPPRPLRHVGVRRPARRPAAAAPCGCGWRADDAWAELRGPTACELLTEDEVAQYPGPARRRPAAAGRATPPPPATRVRRSRAPIGALLMQQEVVSRASATSTGPRSLFRHRLDPWWPGRELTAEQWAGALGRPRRPAAGRRPPGPDRHHPARRTARTGRARCAGTRRTTSTGGPGSRAASAARPSSPSRWPAARSTGARSASAGATMRRSRPTTWSSSAPDRKGGSPQKTQGQYGGTGQPNAADAVVRAPGRSSRTSPADAAASRVSPPR